MLNDITVVQSAVSAFNNAALVMPAFLWWAVLMLPLFFMVRLYGDDFIMRIGWNRDNLLSKVSVWTAFFVFCWVVLFSGNYAVLRDNLSVLPMMTAVIVFLTSLFVSSYVRPLPYMGRKQWLVFIAVLVMVGLSDLHAWWGPVLQIGALVSGILFGRFAGGTMRPMGGCVLVMITTVLAILMQPEFFRFGQLGNLTIFHLMAVLVFGVAAVAAVIVSNLTPRGKIHQSIFAKLKWLGRVVSLLMMSLFVLTEAVPVYLVALLVCAVVFAMSVVHSQKSASDLGDKLFAISLIAFGVLTVMPVISAMGLVYWMNTPAINFWHEFKGLL